MKQAGPLVIGVAELLRRPGSTREELREAILDDLSTSTATVPDGAPITVEVRLEAVNEGIVVRGTVSAPWRGECRRCLRAIESVLVADVLEVFEDEPVEGETSKLDHDRVDLEPLAREAVLLGLPLAPLCQDDCLGLCAECGADRNAGDCGHTVEVADDRWSALSQITFDE